MYEKFGEFDSFEELNRAAAAQKAEGDEEALFALAQENGLDKEDVEDYLDGIVEELATVSMAALGKLKLEKEDLKLGPLCSPILLIFLYYMVIHTEFHHQLVQMLEQFQIL